ncbi:hypothetical protein [Paenibacillus xanthanilyticus]|uniref:Uncharacterized protein n=1 Tax=Paenibacillus xanthanilyticus TaxID=1783531 RepID=A0ABV8K9J9_9BACL
MRQLTLRFWVMLLITVAILLASAGTFISGFTISNKVLKRQVQYDYSENIARTVNVLLRTMQQDLRTSAFNITRYIDNPKKIEGIPTGSIILVPHQLKHSQDDKMHGVSGNVKQKGSDPFR